MDSDTPENKSCRNCKYFIQHYAKKAPIFHEINCGHCVNKNFYYKDKRKSFPFIRACELWELKEEIPAQKEKIDEVLRNMATQITSILLILKLTQDD